MFPSCIKSKTFSESNSSVVVEQPAPNSFVADNVENVKVVTPADLSVPSTSEQQQQQQQLPLGRRLRRTFTNVWSKIRHKKSSIAAQNVNNNYATFNNVPTSATVNSTNKSRSRVYRTKCHIRPVERSSCTGSTSSATNYEDVEDGSSSSNVAPTESRRPSCQRINSAHSLQALAMLKKRSSKSIGEELRALAQYGWYWGPISRRETQNRLSSLPDGSFLVRDSCSDYHLLTLSYRCNGQTFHTRTAFVSGYYSLFPLSETRFDLFPSVVELIQHAVDVSKWGTLCYVNHGRDTMAVRLLTPVSRFDHVRSLQSICRFVIRQNIRWDYIDKLPVPSSLKAYLEQSHFS